MYFVVFGVSWLWSSGHHISFASKWTVKLNGDIYKLNSHF